MPDSRNKRRKTTKFFIGACATAFVFLLIRTSAAAQASSNDDRHCDKIPGVEALWANPATRFVLFGEMHGTVETPKAFGDVVCAALSAGKSVAVGLEWPDSEQSGYDAYLASKGTAVDRKTLLATASWNWPMKDGKTSVAMLGLLDKIRLLREQGADIAFFSFQPSKGFARSADYEAAMAQDILDTGRRFDGRLILMLSGSIHASKDKEFPSGFRIPYDPMGSHLPPDATLSMVVLHRSGGTMWVCTSAGDKAAGAMNCGPHDDPPNDFSGETASLPRLRLFEKARYGYDGALVLDRVTASPPALPTP